MRPDGKSQVTIEYVDKKPVRVDTVVIAAQHNPDVTAADVREGVIEEVINKVIPAELMDKKTKIYVNSTGRFVVGGPKGDCGMTGRKIIVDTYGGVGSHGGGAFSGKDPSKVDRSASYMARYVAKNMVAAGLADRMEVQIAYTIGVAQPVSVNVDTQGTAKISPDRIAADHHGALRSKAEKDHREARPVEADIQKNRVLRPFWAGMTRILRGRNSTWWMR